MKWLKWHHKFSSGCSAWQWRPVDDDTDADEARSIVAELANEYDHSEKYGGIDYEVIDKAPSWVLQEQIKTLGDRLTSTDIALKEFVYLLANGGVENCKQCESAIVATREHYHKHGTGTEIKPCPTCGREILISTIAFWLMPNDNDAIKLLGSLVEQGKRSVKSKKFRWPVEDKDEEDAYHRLSKLGLAGGSAYQNTYEIHATPRGEAEWLKHKERTK